MEPILISVDWKTTSRERIAADWLKMLNIVTLDLTYRPIDWTSSAGGDGAGLGQKSLVILWSVLMSIFSGTFRRWSLIAVLFSSFSAQAADIGKVGAELDEPVKAVNPVEGGVDIILLSPEEGGTYLSPLGIEISFEPELGTTVDLETLKVTVVSKTAIGVIEADITKDIANYATKEGINAPKAEIPAGEHLVTIEVADSKKRVAQRQLAITVREESVLERRARE